MPSALVSTKLDPFHSLKVLMIQLQESRRRKGLLIATATGGSGLASRPRLATPEDQGLEASSQPSDVHSPDASRQSTSLSGDSNLAVVWPEWRSRSSSPSKPSAIGVA